MIAVVRLHALAPDISTGLEILDDVAGKKGDCEIIYSNQLTWLFRALIITLAFGMTVKFASALGFGLPLGVERAEIDSPATYSFRQYPSHGREVGGEAIIPPQDAPERQLAVGRVPLLAQSPNQALILRKRGG